MRFPWGADTFPVDSCMPGPHSRRMPLPPRPVRFTFALDATERDTLRRLAQAARLTDSDMLRHWITTGGGGASEEWIGRAKDVEMREKEVGAP
jgi:hypothetical protein